MSRKVTPLMQQYWEIKSQHLDKVLLFRMGDFFEMFHEDAVTAAPLLNIALTSRNKKAEDNTPMCGVPHHAIATPIAKLLAAGYKVAICDQVEDPKFAKTIVKRAVTRVLSPGMVYDPETLDAQQSNYLCSYDQTNIAFLETTTGEAFYCERKGTQVEWYVQLLKPTELVLSEEVKKQHLIDFGIDGPHLTEHEVSHHLESFLELPEVCQRLTSYVVHMQGKEILNSLRAFELRNFNTRVRLQPNVIRHLEIFETYKGEKRGSLFFAINRTKTASGARLLRDWLSFPLIDREVILQRLNQVEHWRGELSKLKEVRHLFSQMGDIERCLSKIVSPTCGPRDLLSLARSLRSGLSVNALSAPVSVESSLPSPGEEIAAEIERILNPECPSNFKSGGVIGRGYSPQLDELIFLSEEGQELLLEMEAQEKKKTGIPSLKIRYNNVFGYYIEVTKAHSDKVPDHYKRKQTLVNAERYLTQELQELEDKILLARSRRVELEQEIFQQLRGNVLKQAHVLLALARVWSEMDVYTSLAWLSLEHNYQKPSFSEGELHIENGRHPVVEQEVKSPFVPNSLSLGAGDCLLLTGPNMAGKSTLMRQVAVISILAQMGSFVPAQSAHLPIFDGVFTRIGASDYLAEGLSTFMVEMKETAEMLRDATHRSLVVLDEVGRGTSTYDGMALAQSVLEFLMVQKKSITLFATHYHELTQLEESFPQIHNAHMSIVEKSGEIEFLHTLVAQPSNRSYGIQVAQLAGLPAPVVQRAQDLLEKMGDDKLAFQQLSDQQFSHQQLSDQQFSHQQFSQADERGVEGAGRMELDRGKTERSREGTALLQQIEEISLGDMTPLDAMNKIAKWQEELVGEGQGRA